MVKLPSSSQNQFSSQFKVHEKIYHAAYILFIVFYSTVMNTTFRYCSDDDIVQHGPHDATDANVNMVPPLY